ASQVHRTWPPHLADAANFLPANHVSTPYNPAHFSAPPASAPPPEAPADKSQRAPAAAHRSGTPDVQSPSQIPRVLPRELAPSDVPYSIQHSGPPEQFFPPPMPRQSAPWPQTGPPHKAAP